MGIEPKKMGREMQQYYEIQGPNVKLHESRAHFQTNLSCLCFIGPDNATAHVTIA